MIAVTGTTGEIGKRVAARLSERGVILRLLVRDPSKAPRLQGASISRIESYADTESAEKALTGVKTLFLVSAHDRMGIISHSIENNIPLPSYDRVQQHKAIVSAAIEAGVERIVYLSFINAAEDATFILSGDHFHTEEFIRSAGLKYTFLRPNLYMDKVPLMVDENDLIKTPAGQGRVSWVSRDDIADVAAHVLTEPGHDGKTYDVTGPEALTMEETAICLSEAAGRNITCISLTPQETRLKRNASRMAEYEKHRIELTGRGMTDYEVEVWTTHYLQIAEGEVTAVSDTVKKICGRPAEPLAGYLKKSRISV